MWLYPCNVPITESSRLLRNDAYSNISPAKPANALPFPVPAVCYSVHYTHTNTFRKGQWSEFPCTYTKYIHSFCVCIISIWRCLCVRFDIMVYVYVDARRGAADYMGLDLAWLVFMWCECICVEPSYFPFQPKHCGVVPKRGSIASDLTQHYVDLNANANTYYIERSIMSICLYRIHKSIEYIVSLHLYFSDLYDIGIPKHR